MSTPLEQEVQRYKAEVDAALRGTPERAARVARLERIVGSTPSAHVARAAASKIGELLDAAVAEVNAARAAEGRPVPGDGSWRPGPAGGEAP